MIVVVRRTRSLIGSDIDGRRVAAPGADDTVDRMKIEPSQMLSALEFHALIDEDTRKVAVTRTEGVLQQLARLCRANDLPVSLLPQVMELYAVSSRQVAAEKFREQAAERSRRLPMSVISTDREWKPLRIKSGRDGCGHDSVSRVVVRPQFLAYRVEEIEICGDPGRWLVHDIRVGNRSQRMSATPPLPGSVFRKGGIMSDLRFETCQTGMDLSFDVEYVGPVPEGEVFEAVLVGTAVE